jgi:hypothetical protein
VITLEETLDEKDHIAELAFTTDELLSLPINERDFIFAASFIVNDIRFHWSMMIMARADAAETHIKLMQTVRQLWCTRKLSAVIVEADNSISAFNGKIGWLKDMGKDKPHISRDKRKSRAFRIANSIRNKTTNHFDTSLLGSQLSGFDANVRHTHYVHISHGNSICAISEQIFTLPLLQSEFNLPANEALNEFDK